MVRLKNVLLLTWLVIGQWNVECEDKSGTDWSVYQRLRTLQIGLVQNKNLDKYMSASNDWIYDNAAFEGDSTRVKRSYSSEQCIKDLKTIQAAFNDTGSDWANKSKPYDL